MEETLFLIKPDAVARNLSGEILSRIEKKGLVIKALEMKKPNNEIIEKHYAEHVGKDFYQSLVEFISSGSLIAGILEGPNAVAAFRQLAGETDPVKSAKPGSIRGDFGLDVQKNLVHGSDSVESAKREIAIWFPNY